MHDSFNVFVIGPMGADKDKPSEKATPISQHMINLASALRAILPRYVAPPSRWNVISPLEGAAGDITDWVFNNMDDADLAVADITSRTPSVMYELAFFHALGTPIILVDSDTVDDNSRPFYLRGTNILTVKDFDVETLSLALNDRIQRFFNPEDLQNFSSNPITKFYGTPLSEVSGTSTVAAGYYENMVSRVINRHSGVMGQAAGASMETFYIVKPDNELSMADDYPKFKRIIGLDEETTFKDAQGDRIVSVYYDGKRAFDLPRTVYSLAFSPRLTRLDAMINLLEEQGQHVSEDLQAQIRARGVEKITENFFATLRRTINRDRSNPRKKWKIVSMAELQEILGRPGTTSENTA